MSHQSGAGEFGRATGRTLEDDSEQDQRRYRAYQFELISRHCGPSVLEVGAGLGEFASQFRGLRRHVVTDVDPACVAHMKHRFADRAEVEARQLDLQDASAGVGASVSTVVAVNVLEHVQEDSAALRSLAAIVEPGGTIVLWVPGYMQLYGEFDRRVGHVRRYTPDTLRAAIVGAGLEPTDVHPVNLLGGIAWWLAVRRGGVGDAGRSPARRRALTRTYNRLVVPVTRTLESRITPPFGQSVLGVATVPATPPPRKAEKASAAPAGSSASPGSW
ncbi:MAG: class I SAM-dependent methyltransferase [Solirubrobacteraceae bacterium]